jgi:hypothetical protein
LNHKLEIKGEILYGSEKSKLEKITINTNPYQLLAGKFLLSLFCKDLHLTAFTRFGQRNFLSSFAWNASSGTPAEERGRSSCLQRENIDSPLEARLLTWGGGK